MTLNIQTKLFLLLAGLTSAVLVVVLLAVSGTLSSVTQTDVIQDFEQTQATFNTEQGLRYDRLVESALLIAENSTFKANVSLEDPASVQVSVSEFARFTKADLLVVTDRRGTVMARFDAPDRYGDDLTHRPGVVRALGGTEPAFEPAWPELWTVGEALYQVATVPVYIGGGVAGTLTLGARLTRTEAEALKGDMPIAITFFLGDDLLTTTASGTQAAAYRGFPEDCREKVARMLEEGAPSRPFEVEIGGEEMFAFISPLGTGAPAYYVAAIPRAEMLSTLFQLRRTILFYALLSLLATLVLAVTLGRLVTRPVKRLAAAMRRVRAGDLSAEVEPTTHDEIGQLTESFNEMIVGLRERFQLTKYVGSHTVSMIEASQGADEALGGTRRELAVLFADIRGFTAYSETRDPEDVVALLNQCLGVQARLVRTHGGSVDKFVGDEMVALFGGGDGEPLENALRCAVAIQEAMHQSDAPLEVGVGVNYGPMVLGSMGAADRRDYTVIGSAVNLGARLCSAAAPRQILVRAALLDAGLRAAFVTRPVPPMDLKGFSAPVEIAAVEGLAVEGAAEAAPNASPMHAPTDDVPA